MQVSVGSRQVEAGSEGTHGRHDGGLANDRRRSTRRVLESMTRTPPATALPSPTVHFRQQPGSLFVSLLTTIITSLTLHNQPAHPSAMAMHASDPSSKTALHVQEGAEPAVRPRLHLSRTLPFADAFPTIQTYPEGSSRNDFPATRTGPSASEENRFLRSTVAPSVGNESLQPVTDTQAGNTMPGQTGKDSKDGESWPVDVPIST